VSDHTLLGLGGIVKTCIFCKEEKPANLFPKRTAAVDGRRSWCTSCKMNWNDPERVKQYSRIRAAIYLVEHKNDPQFIEKRRERQLEWQKSGKRRERDWINREARYAKTKAWRDLNREKVRKTNRISKSKRREKIKQEWASWYAANRDRVLARGRKYRAKRKDHYAALFKEWSLKNKDARKEYAREWIQKNRPIVQARNRRGYARRRGAADGLFTAADWLKVLEKGGHRCCYCNKQIEDIKKPMKEMTSEEISRKATMEHVEPVAKGGSHRAENIVAACFPCNSSKSSKSIEEWERYKKLTMVVKQ
jgi:hypothetical protein